MSTFWDWITENADPVTAAVAVLGLIVASALAWEAIRISRKSSRNDRAERLTSYFSELLDRVIEYQHPALLPYWNSPVGKPVDPLGADAKDLHRAIARASSSLELARTVELRPLDAEIRVLECTLWPLYVFATETDSEREIAYHRATDEGLAQESSNAWREVQEQLRPRLESARDDGCDIDVESILEETRLSAVAAYPVRYVGRMQLADATLNWAMGQLTLAFRDRLPKIAASRPASD